MKKTMSLIAVLVFALSVAGTACAEDYKGKVEKVDGKLITIKITKGKASDFEVGDKVMIETKDGKPKKKGGATLQGC